MTASHRFLVDEMLTNLAHWLRAAGYDTELAESGVADRELIKQARTDKRWLLTRDHKMVEFRQATDNVILLRSQSLEGYVQELNHDLAIHWLYKPLSRCMMCNTLIELAADLHWRRVPENSRQYIKTLYWCPGCDRVYWDGSHTRRIRQRLQDWSLQALEYSENV